MKKYITAILAAVLVSCSGAGINNPDNWQNYYPSEDNPPYQGDDAEDYPDRTAPVGCSDLVLLYGGSQHRTPFEWPSTTIRDYVTWQDPQGSQHWLFDGFLLLEFMLTQHNVTLITGYQWQGSYLVSASKAHWQSLADYYFKSGSGVDAIENSCREAASVIGNPPSKRKIVIGIPEPIQYYDSHNKSGGTKYWGELEGTELDFSLPSHRIAAVKWYIDRVRANFKAKNYQYVELAGFYWVAEKATQSRDILKGVSEYLHGMNYSFNWIPYYTADGYASWKSFGFDFAYLQPNYFFNESVPFSRLADACNDAISAGMGMEVEFDGNASVANGRGYRLRDYMSEFKRFGIWDSCPLAYYQGAWALKWLKDSSKPEDVALYNDFCNWVVTRPFREK